MSASAFSCSAFVSWNESVPLHMTSLPSKYVVTHTHTHTHTHVHTHTHAQSEVGCTQGYCRVCCSEDCDCEWEGGTDRRMSTQGSG